MGNVPVSYRLDKPSPKTEAWRVILPARCLHRHFPRHTARTEGAVIGRLSLRGAFTKSTAGFETPKGRGEKKAILDSE